MPSRNFEELVTLMERLRGPGGCPWDREQKLEDLRPFIIEEAYEVVDAIDRNDRESLREEVGDLLLEAVFVAQIAKEEGSFEIGDAIGAIHDKLVRRHPHVFAEVVAETSDEVLTNWEKLKNQERVAKDESLLSGVPQALPALLKAMRLTEKAARVGFDWERTEDVISKLEEETAELKDAIARGEREEILHEMGDLLFTIANIARRMQMDPESACQKSNLKFTRRFQHIEKRMRESGRSFDGASLEELDRMWDEAKEIVG